MLNFWAPLLIQNRQIGPQLKQSLTGRSLTIYDINRGALLIAVRRRLVFARSDD
jgi:hypothetical protein